MTKAEKDIHDIAIDKNDDKIKGLQLEIWDPKLLINGFILAEDHKDYDIIKHVSEGYLLIIIPRYIQFSINIMEKVILSYANIWELFLSIMVTRK